MLASESLPQPIPTISHEALMAAERAEKYRRQLERPEIFPSRQNWEYIIRYGMPSLAPLLMRKYLMSWLTPTEERSEFHDLAIEFFVQYLQAIPRREALEAVISERTTATEACVALIRDARLFDASVFESMISDSADIAFVCDCLSAYQDEYTAADLRDMMRLLKRLRSLPALGSIEETRSFFGRNELKYICVNGHVNPSETDFCRQCGLDIHGLNEEQAGAIDAYEQRIRLLDKMLRDYRPPQPIIES